MMNPKRWIGARRLAFAILGALLSMSPAQAAYVIATPQICIESVFVGPCETGAPGFGVPGATVGLSRLWADPGYSISAETELTANYGFFSGSARVGGFDNPVLGGTKFNYSFVRIARSFGHFADVLTAGTGGGSGFFRIPLHVSGDASIAWQNGGGSVSLSFDCVSNAPGSPFAIGHCPTVPFSFSGDEYFDTVVNLDVPIVLGAPFEYRVSVLLTAYSGHGYGDLIPFEGHAGGNFVARLPLHGASVLDASGTAIPNAAISASESGTVYAPEPISAASGAAVLGAIGALALRARRKQPLTNAVPGVKFSVCQVV
jgi:hypothetical protein